VPVEVRGFTVRNARIVPGADGDLLVLELTNVTDGVTEALTQFETGGAGNDQHVQLHWMGKLDSAKNYELLVRDNDSSYTVEGVEKYTYAKIARSSVHP
jgi:hypothetical protein